MTYLSRGKRSIIEQGYAADLKLWSKHFKINPPIVRVRAKRGGGNYRRQRQMITMPPNAGRGALVHEFAHHLNWVVYGKSGHGKTFRIALVQAVAAIYGRADEYNWASEYANVVKWAKAYGLIKKEMK